MGCPWASFSIAGLRCSAGCWAGARPASESTAINAGITAALPPFPQPDAFSNCMNRMLPNPENTEDPRNQRGQDRHLPVVIGCRPRESPIMIHNSRNSDSTCWTRREALRFLGLGAAFSQHAVFGAKAPRFSRGAVIRTVLKDI